MIYEVQFMLDHRGRLGEILNVMPVGYKWGPGDTVPPLCVRVMDIGDIPLESIADNQYRIDPLALKVVGGVTTVHDDKLGLVLRPSDKWKSTQQLEGAKEFLAPKFNGAGADEFEKHYTETGYVQYAIEAVGIKDILLREIGEAAVTEFDTELAKRLPPVALPHSAESEQAMRETMRLAYGHVLSKNALGKL